MSMVLVPLSFSAQKVWAQVTIVAGSSAILNFGSMSAGAAGGTVVINTAGARSTTGSVVGVTGAGLISQGVFYVNGSTGLPIDITVTSPAFTLTNGGDTMTVNNFNLLTNAGGNSGTITLAANPTTFPIGATLNVGPAQAAGTYTGSYTINVNYQ